MRPDQSDGVSDADNSAERGNDHLSLVALTARQREIAGLIARGLTNAEIAERLVLTQGTVANHVASILQRLQFGSRTQVVAWAVEHGLHGGQDRLLTTLERLLEHQPTTLKSAMDHAANLVADALSAEKVDAFLEELGTRTLVAVGTSATPLGHKQRALGLDRQAIVNGGRIAQVFENGQTHFDTDVQKDDQELIGVRRDLNVRSQIAVPLEIAGVRRGVLSAVSTQAHFFTERDLMFLQAVSRWVGSAAQRGELAERSVLASVQQGRRMAAEELVTIVAQDLRFHLAPIRNRVDLMHRRAKRTQDPATQPDALALRQAVNRLDGLITDLLDIAGIDQGSFSVFLEPVDLAALVGEVVASLGATEQPITVETPYELRVAADSARLRQVVRALLTHAIQHGPAGAIILVRASVLESDSRRWAVLEVADQAPVADAPLSLRGVDQRGRWPASSGLGIGLFLAREIAVAHGGTLEIVSGSSAGMQFRFVLPAHVPDNSSTRQ
ncbi:MAG: hypothetical protein NVSMB2_15690 [Chloroflexota bacterium]